MGFRGMWHVITRRKVIVETENEGGPLRRCLGTLDLTALGVGSTLGVGVYVLAGHVARDNSGPSVIISFLLAAIVSIFAGLCYAELGSKVPRAGSAYVYTYVCIGEFVAFIIGWNLILEYIIGSASVSRAISLYLDTLLNGTLKQTFREIAPIDVPYLSDYFDFLAFGLSLVLGVVLAFGLKKSSTVNSIFTLLNICVIIFIIIAGALKADVNNWDISLDSIPEENKAEAGSGGFFPFGWSGMISGAAVCFFGFVGFDCIATTGEEVKNPKRAVPLAIIISLAIIFLSYFGVSSVVTLMWPYYLQDRDAPIPYAFGEVGWVWAKWIVTIGGMFGLFTSLFGSMFPLPRILFAMASDGLIFKFLGSINPTFRTPVVGTLLAATLTGTMGGLFEMKHLINMMSIGTLMAYTIVATCVIVHRYEDGKSPLLQNAEYTESSYLMFRRKCYSFGAIVKQIVKCPLGTEPSHISSLIVGFSMACYCVFCFAFSLCLMYLLNDMVNGVWWAIFLTSFFGCLMLICLLVISSQPQSKIKLSTSFEVPLVPLIPCLSIFTNIYLMLMLDVHTWIRFGVWMAIGLPVYLICLCIYDRGSNYLTYAQKTSVNGNSVGKLNYASDLSLTECREKTVSFEPGVKVIKEMANHKERELSLTKPSDDIKTMNDDLQSKPSQGEVSVNLPIENYQIETLEGYENIHVCEPMSADSCGEIKIIELLDQILLEEEQASARYSIESPEEIFHDPITPPLGTIVPVVSDVNSVLYNDVPIVPPSDNNVVVLVHREDTAQSHCETTDDEESEVFNRFDSIHFSHEDIPECLNVELKDIDSYSSDEDIGKHIKPDEQIKIKDVEDVIFIPVPPPIDEAYFTKPKVIKLKNTKKYERNNSQTTVKPNRRTSIDDNSHLKFGTDRQGSFIRKLNALLKNKATGSKYTRSTILKPASSDTDTDDDHVVSRERHKSEPNIATPRTSGDKNEESNITDINNTDNEVNLPIIINEPEIVNPAEGDKEIPVENDKPLTKDDFKLKLESILRLSPMLSRAKSNKNASKIEKDDEVKVTLEHDANKIEDENPEIRKPKPRENFSETMKLKRAQFNDVLKSMLELTQKRDSVNSPDRDIV